MLVVALAITACVRPATATPATVGWCLAILQRLAGGPDNWQARSTQYIQVFRARADGLCYIEDAPKVAPVAAPAK